MALAVRAARMVIVEVVADLGIPERTPVAELRANPEGRGVMALKVEGASVVMEKEKETPAVAETAALEIKAGPVAAWTVTVKLPVAVFPVRELIALKPSVKAPVSLAPGARVMAPVAVSTVAQLGRDVTE
ncbi:MAG: hypothetical protein EBS97_03585 [Verrucomicrobia bacterium]|nr:hypothetical protein [Verrucomicrobiota bacterium]